MEKLIISSSPHVKGKLSTRRIMIDVCIAMLPCVICAILFFGWRAFGMVAVSVIACGLFEFLYNLTRIKKWSWMNVWKSCTLRDCSFAVTGILVALNVPTTLPFWCLIIGDAFAILIVKMIFGGIGKNFLNPAMAARVFLFLSFASMTKAASISSNIIGLEQNVMTSATWLGDNLARSPEIFGDFYHLFLGSTAASAMGETSVLAILIGFIYLTVRKVIDPRIPFVIITTVFLLGVLFDGIPRFPNRFDLVMKVGLGHIMSGGLMLGAVFMATDYSTSPNTHFGQMIFALLIAFLTVLLRVFTPMPEGMSFAILTMNAIAPLIDKAIKVRPFGYVKPKKEQKPKKEKLKKGLEETKGQKEQGGDQR